ncbi:hypothetical protein [Pseudomarimonas arenosa]|uniref:Uncharacterized protein n=1 Tax=Pseudomarimonas arenosa TaxID=2774145 RepID=A0AAW3ZRD4_9GAMM|nr:hypothetical protein [Pseudomarimonas arenosa]MBD8526811.1 hypothetical protein [Pseudomarimonas arenosa]
MLLLAYRGGWSTMFRGTSAVVKAGVLTVVTAALLSQVFNLSQWASPVRCAGSIAGDGVITMAFTLFALGATFLLILIIGVIVLIVLAIMLKRQLLGERASSAGD